MRITKELLKRYGRGTCTTKERKAVEEWLTEPEYPSLRVSKTERPKADSDEIWSMLSEGRPRLKKQMSHQRAKNLVLFNNVAKYAAAACFIIGVFFIGRFSVSTSYANPTTSTLGTNHLHIYGANGVSTNLPGDSFTIGFDNLVKLFNDSAHPKVIQIGDKNFELRGYGTYSLSGTQENPQLQRSSGPQDPLFRNSTLTGDYSILRNK